MKKRHKNRKFTTVFSNIFCTLAYFTKLYLKIENFYSLNNTSKLTLKMV